MRSHRIKMVADGLMVGFVGYLTVVLFFALMNLFTGHPPFHTAALLGSALFFGLRDPGALIPGPAPVIAYNGVHLLASLFIGLGAAWLLYETERHHPLWYGVFFIFLAGFIYSVVVMGVFAAEIAHVLSWPAIVAANLAAGATGGGYLGWRHGRLLRELRGAG